MRTPPAWAALPCAVLDAGRPASDNVSLALQTCHKQYKNAMEMETHLSSYDHHHTKVGVLILLPTSCDDAWYLCMLIRCRGSKMQTDL